MFCAEDILRHACKDGRIVHVDDVPTGLHCGCFCPNPKCGEQLVAKNRKFAERVKVTHFAHQSKGECPGARESALHLLAKQVIADRKRVWVPEIPLFTDGSDPWKVFRPARVVGLDSVQLETSLEGFVPDITAVVGGETVLIEICVTHAVEEPKANAAHKHGWTMLEIYLGDLLGQDFSEDTVTKRLQGDGAVARWIRHEAAIQMRVSVGSVAGQVGAGIEDCPFALGLGKEFERTADRTVSWIEYKNAAPCDRCPCRLDIIPTADQSPRGYIQCLGESRIDSVQAFDRYRANGGLPEPQWVQVFRIERQLRDAQRYYAGDVIRTVAARSNLDISSKAVIENARQKLKSISRRLDNAYSNYRSGKIGYNDKEWYIPFCEVGPGETRVELTPDPTRKRLQPLPHKRPLLPGCAESISQQSASNLGLYWDRQLWNWIFFSPGSFAENKIGTPRPTVPVILRELIDPAVNWIPVFPAEARDLSAIRPID